MPVVSREENLMNPDARTTLLRKGIPFGTPRDWALYPVTGRELSDQRAHLADHEESRDVPFPDLSALPSTLHGEAG
jgi:hypothetical protein